MINHKREQVYDTCQDVVYMGELPGLEGLLRLYFSKGGNKSGLKAYRKSGIYYPEVLFLGI